MQNGVTGNARITRPTKHLTPHILVGVIKMLDLDRQVRIMIQNPEVPGGSMCYMPRDGVYGNEHELVILNSDENKQKALDFRYRHALLQSKNLFSFFLHINKPYRLLLLNVIVGMGSYSFNGEYEQILKFAWMQTEFPHQSRVSDLINLFEKADPLLLMSDEERERLARFPDEIKVYRGLQDERAKTRGLSWTTDKAKALWFATRWKSPNARLAQATIGKKHLYIYSNERSEKEVVVNPRHLKSVKVLGISEMHMQDEL